MGICCGACHVRLKETDIVTMDWINTLCHYTCLGNSADLIEDIDTFKNIKDKYWLFRDEAIH